MIILFSKHIYIYILQQQQKPNENAHYTRWNQKNIYSYYIYTIIQPA